MAADAVLQRRIQNWILGLAKQMLRILSRTKEESPNSFCRTVHLKQHTVLEGEGRRGRGPTLPNPSQRGEKATAKPLLGAYQPGNLLHAGKHGR